MNTPGLSRRGAFARLAAFAAAALGGTAAAAGPSATPRRRVAYHLSDLDKVTFALGNIVNHIAGEGGAANVDIVLVVNGPALMAFRADVADANVRAKLAIISAERVALGACGNTLDAQNMTVADLIPGFVRIDEGGVVRLAHLQDDGYAYIRP